MAKILRLGKKKKINSFVLRSTFRIFAPTFETGNKIITNMKQRNSIVAIAGLLLSLASQTWAANTKQTVTQVSATVELTANVDYFVSSATPFGEAGVVNIVNTDHAVLILSNVKPSEAIPMLAAHVQINGAKAVNNTNCQVKLYNRGSIILPYGNSTKPLTVYSEQNFGGESCNNFGLENSGGYMNTLTEAKLNNKIRSFKLKRGYMVTFSNLPNGRGYSRCFIAAYNDLEISELPAVMDQKISSYRIFKWYDAGKKHLASYMNKDAMSALNVQSSYDWGQGNNSFLPDYEWVPNTPKQYGPSKFVSMATEDGKLELQWYDANGEYNQLMEVQKKGGIGGGAYLQAYGSGDVNAEASIKKNLDITPNATYYFRAGVLNGNPNMRLSLTTNGTSENKIVSNMKSTTSWERIGATFNSNSYTKALLSFRNLLYKAQIDKMELYRLFDTHEDCQQPFHCCRHEQRCRRVL